VTVHPVPDHAGDLLAEAVRAERLTLEADPAASSGGFPTPGGPAAARNGPPPADGVKGRRGRRSIPIIVALTACAGITYLVLFVPAPRYGGTENSGPRVAAPASDLVSAPAETGAGSPSPDTSPSAPGSSSTPGPTPATTPTAAQSHPTTPPPAHPTKAPAHGGTPAGSSRGTLAVGDSGCRHVGAAGLPRSCTLTLTARGGTVRWSVTSIDPGIARVRASGGGTLSGGRSTTVTVIVSPTIGCYIRGGGNAIIGFSPSATASVTYACWHV
jgi:hypothetical protein